eukprot:1634162-Amphidinium_carterae.2
MRAFHAINSLGIVEPNAENVDKLATFLGATASPPHDAWDTQMAERSNPPSLLHGLDKSILRRKRGKSTDQYGWTAEAARALLVGAGNMCTPLSDSAWMQVRPSLWAKLLSSTLLQLQQQQLEPLFAERQWALGLDNPTTRCVYSISEAMRQNPSLCAIQIDLENAFPTLSRAHAVRAMEHFQLEHTSMLARCILPPRTAWIAGTLQQVPPTHSGVVQGDPLSTALFALALRKCMEDAQRSMPPSARLVAYVDDCVLLVHPDEASTAWTALERELTAASLNIKTSKSRLWLQQHHPCDVPPLSTIVAAHPDTRGLHLVGIRATSWEDTPLACQPLFKNICRLLQPSWTGVKLCAPRYMLQLTMSRAVPIQATLVLANAAQIVVEDMLRTVTGSLVLNRQTQLAFAPPHAGGLGIPFLPTTACTARYAALWQLQQPDDAGSFASHFANHSSYPRVTGCQGTQAHPANDLSLFSNTPERVCKRMCKIDMWRESMWGLFPATMQPSHTYGVPKTP